ncbi:MAG: sigma-70 family RNA polymerase sigma factor [Planctomycetaceae bacterium]|nr:sigma-70 family RNA polymerase sigma factor [Planctomycetaceae bacterium]
MSEVTRILERISIGEPKASDELLPLLYGELRRMADAQMSSEPAGHTLQPTALVHEAYLRLVHQEPVPEWNHRGHFFAAAAQAMRRILVERARRKASLRHGGELRRRPLDESALVVTDANPELLALDEALSKLAEQEPQVAGVVSLHRFAGLTLEETAEALDLSARTVYRYWAYARAWLLEEMAGPEMPA